MKPDLCWLKGFILKKVFFFFLASFFFLIFSFFINKIHAGWGQIRPAPKATTDPTPSTRIAIALRRKRQQKHAALDLRAQPILVLRRKQQLRPIDPPCAESANGSKGGGALTWAFVYNLLTYMNVYITRANASQDHAFHKNTRIKKNSFVFFRGATYLTYYAYPTKMDLKTRKINGENSQKSSLEREPRALGARAFPPTAFTVEPRGPFQLLCPGSKKRQHLGTRLKGVPN